LIQVENERDAMDSKYQTHRRFHDTKTQETAPMHTNMGLCRGGFLLYNYEILAL